MNRYHKNTRYVELDKISTRSVNGLFMRTNVKIVVKAISNGEASMHTTRFIDYYELLLEMIFMVGYTLSFQISMQAM